jgi:hypothetical protein
VGRLWSGSHGGLRREVRDQHEDLPRRAGRVREDVHRASAEVSA